MRQGEGNAMFTRCSHITTLLRTNHSNHRTIGSLSQRRDCSPRKVYSQTRFYFFVCGCKALKYATYSGLPSALTRTRDRPKKHTSCSNLHAKFGSGCQLLPYKETGHFWARRGLFLGSKVPVFSVEALLLSLMFFSDEIIATT